MFFFYEISKLREFDRVKLSLGDSIKEEEDEKFLDIWIFLKSGVLFIVENFVDKKDYKIEYDLDER